MATKKSTPVKKVSKAPAKTADISKAKLSEALFGAEVNTQLIAQAVRVYLANQREGGAKVKTRGEVEGSTRKIYRQKGTGKARHGSIRAPIFVGGGIVFGPVTRDYSLKMSKSMRRGALVSALSSKRSDVLVVEGLESVEPKTKNVVAAFTAAGVTKSVLFVVAKDSARLVRAARNIAHVDVINATDLHPYALVTHAHIVFTKQSLVEMEKHFTTHI